MKRSHTLARWAGLALLAAAVALGGCASLKAALTPAAIHHEATALYIATATAMNFDEAGGVSLARYAKDEQIRSDAWMLLQAERAAYARSGPHPETLLDLQADALKPPGQ